MKLNVYKTGAYNLCGCIFVILVNNLGNLKDVGSLMVRVLNKEPDLVWQREQTII